MIKYVYDKGNCVGCPPEMGCLGRMCSQCWEYKIICDICNEDGDEVWRDEDTETDYCEDCLKNALKHITFDNAKDYVNEGEDSDEY